MTQHLEREVIEQMLSHDRLRRAVTPTFAALAALAGPAVLPADLRPDWHWLWGARTAGGLALCLLAASFLVRRQTSAVRLGAIASAVVALPFFVLAGGGVAHLMTGDSSMRVTAVGGVAEGAVIVAAAAWLTVLASLGRGAFLAGRLTLSCLYVVWWMSMLYSLTDLSILGVAVVVGALLFGAHARSYLHLRRDREEGDEVLLKLQDLQDRYLLDA